MQNKTHIKYLKKLIGGYFPIHSVIVFSERCVLKDVQIKSNHIHVVNRYNIASVVSEICSRIPNEPLNENAINELYHKLYPYTQLSETEKQQHVDSIKERFTPADALSASTIPNLTDCPGNKKTEALVIPTDTTKTIKKESANASSDLKCPACGGKLLLRVAKKGQYAGNQFYGCSNYPKCKYLQNINTITV